MDKYGLRGIPSLILLAKDGETALKKDCRGDVMGMQGISLDCVPAWRELVEKS